MRPIVRGGGGGGGRTRGKRPQQRPGGFPQQSGGMPGMKQPGGPDYFGQLNAFQPDISGEQPGPISQGWGGAGGDLGTMGMIKVNSWLNTFQDPAERARAMNGIGYFNQGNPFDPASARGSGMNRFNRQNAQANEQTGGYSAPGTYLHQSGGYGAPQGQAPDMNFGGYIGATNVAEGGAAQYTPLAPRGGGRIKRRGGTFGGMSY